MKTLEEIRVLSNLKNRQTVYYRIKATGIEKAEGYAPSYITVDGKPMRCFTDEEAEKLIYMKLNNISNN